MSGQEAESSENFEDDTGLCSWINIEVSQILLEELPGIIGQVTDKLIAKFQEQTVAFCSVGETIEVTRGRDLGIGKRHEKRKWAKDLAFSAIDEEFEVANLGAISQVDFDTCGMCGGTYRFACHKFKCYKCGEKGHVVRNCKKDQTHFHYHRLGHLKPDCPTWAAEREKDPIPVVREEVKVGSQEITGMNFDLQFYLEWICT